jgi:hypothetical protein
MLAVVGFSVSCRSFFEGAEVNESQEKVLEKNGRFGTINGAVNLWGSAIINGVTPFFLCLGYYIHA